MHSYSNIGETSTSSNTPTGITIPTLQQDTTPFQIHSSARRDTYPFISYPATLTTRSARSSISDPSPNPHSSTTFSSHFGFTKPLADLSAPLGPTLHPAHSYLSSSASTSSYVTYQPWINSGQQAYYSFGSHHSVNPRQSLSPLADSDAVASVLGQSLAGPPCFPNLPFIPYTTPDGICNHNPEQPRLSPTYPTWPYSFPATLPLALADFPPLSIEHDGYHLPSPWLHARMMPPISSHIPTSSLLDISYLYPDPKVNPLPSRSPPLEVLHQPDPTPIPLFETSIDPSSSPILSLFPLTTRNPLHHSSSSIPLVPLSPSPPNLLSSTVQRKHQDSSSRSDRKKKRSRTLSTMEDDLSSETMEKKAQLDPGVNMLSDISVKAKENPEDGKIHNSSSHPLTMVSDEDTVLETARTPGDKDSDEDTSDVADQLCEISEQEASGVLEGERGTLGRAYNALLKRNARLRALGIDVDGDDDEDGDE